LETQGKEDFVNETQGDFPEDRWPDAFSWLYMSIRCTGCNEFIPEWISYETA
jgi:hypothetical protein